MPEYIVRWEIDIDADSPREAAEKALEVVRDPASIATFFQVLDRDSLEEAEWESVDLAEPEEVVDA